MSETHDLDPEILEILKSHLKKNERVYQWDQHGDEVKVMLIADLDSPSLRSLVESGNRRSRRSQR